MPRGSLLVDRLDSALGQGMGAAVAAVLVSPLPLALLAAGLLRARYAELERAEEQRGLMEISLEAPARTSDWGVTAAVLLQLENAFDAKTAEQVADGSAEPTLPEEVASWWTRFLQEVAAASPSAAAPGPPRCGGLPGASGMRGLWSDCRLLEIPVVKEAAANPVAVQLVPPVAYTPFVSSAEEQPAARLEQRLSDAFRTSISPLVDAAGLKGASTIANLYFYGQAGTLMFWGRERAWVDALVNEIPYDTRTPRYFLRTRGNWRRWRGGHLSELDSNPLGYSAPAPFPPAVTFRSERYVDSAGAGLVWTACLAVVATAPAGSPGSPDLPPGGSSASSAAPASSPEWGDLLGVLCADVADSSEMAGKLWGAGAGAPESEPTPAGDKERRVSSWWRTGLVTYRAEDEVQSSFVFEGQQLPPDSRRREDVFLALRGSGHGPRSAVLPVPEADDGGHQAGYLLPIGRRLDQQRFVYLESPSWPQPGILEILFGLALLPLPGMIWFAGARVKAAIVQRERSALSVDQLQVGVVRTDGQGRIIFANDRAEELLGVPLRGGEGSVPVTMDSLLDPLVILADDFGAAWPTSALHGRVVHISQVNEHRTAGRSSRYFARLGPVLLTRVDAPRFSNHPYWCPWLEVTGSARLDSPGSAGTRGAGEVYGVLRSVSPELGWGVLEPCWESAATARRGAS